MKKKIKDKKINKWHSALKKAGVTTTKAEHSIMIESLYQ